MLKSLLKFLFIFFIPLQQVWAQNNIVTYAGNAGQEAFKNVTQISNGTFLVCGYATDLNWIPASTPKTLITPTGINNALGSNKYGIILQFSSDFQTMLHCVYFPQNAVEEISIMKFSSLPYAPTGDLFISGNTRDTKANKGGYFLAKLNNNFLNGVPTALVWSKGIWAEGETYLNQPWDVGSDGKVVYIEGQSHAADWCQVSRLDANGAFDIVPNWRTHWSTAGSEYKGLAANYMGTAPLSYSGIVLKRNGRCDLRSWTNADFNSWSSDGNGGMKKGKWPMDFLYNAPCDIAAVSTAGPGYNGYKVSSTQTYAGLAVAIDKRDNSFYIGMNTKSVINSSGLPDFEPAVFKMNTVGDLLWWSRLYHEVTPAGDTVLSTPDQYIDGLAIDYAGNNLVVNARCHGNNVSNLWQGQNIAASPGLQGFQKQFTGTNGNIHISWLGKLTLNTGDLKASTFVAEFNNTTTGLGAPHPDPNLDGFPNPNGGWPNVNTTRIARNGMSVATDGSVMLAGVGRRTITTANAHQKMVKQLSTSTANNSTWNQFVRSYSPNLDSLRYSSLVVGMWDTITGVGGDNTNIYATYKATQGIVAVGRQRGSVTNGVDIPVQNVTPWGSLSSSDSSAILVYLKAPNLLNANDSQFSFTAAPLSVAIEFSGARVGEANQLNWRVAEQNGIAYYSLEKSKDGKEFTNLFNQVAVEQNQKVYTLIDNAPYQGENYYRLKTTYLNDEEMYSNVVNIFNNGKTGFVLMPNPTSDVLKIQMQQTNQQNAEVIICDLSGKQLWNGNITTANNTISVAQLPNGIYLLKLKQNGAVQAQLFEKK
jgi:hypothetical protein